MTCNHHFEARYDYEPAQLPDGVSMDDIKGTDARADWVLEKFQRRTYVRDICTMCGETRERDGTPDA